MDNPQFYWDWLKHEQSVFNDRSNFFLVAEAMLLAGLATMLPSFSSSTCSELVSSATKALTISGEFVTVVWLYVNATQIYLTLGHVARSVRECESRAVSFKHPLKLCPNNVTIGILLPLGILAVWFYLAFKVWWQGVLLLPILAILFLGVFCIKKIKL